MASTVLEAFASTGSNSRWFKVLGWTCMPCFCAGATCLAVAEPLSNFNEMYQRVIALYGGPVAVKALAARVRNELAIFRSAVTTVNNSLPDADSNIIIGDLKMHTMIYEKNTRIKQVMDTVDTVLSLLARFRDSDNRRQKYISLVWDEYLRLGGNYHVIVYGIIEYMCHNYDPTSPAMKSHLEALLKDTAMRVEVLSHKAQATAAST